MFNNFSSILSRLISVPKFPATERPECALVCRSKSSNGGRGGRPIQLSEIVLDGTPCGFDSPDVCISGKCIKAGCDGKIHTDPLAKVKTFDACGECGGDNSSCQQDRFNWQVKHHVSDSDISQGAIRLSFFL